MRLLLTGANGQVGWELRRSLVPLGEVIAMDRKACDLSRQQDLPRIIREAAPDVIVNAAAYTAVDRAEEEEPLATMINATAVGIIADAARKLGALLIYYSTDYVFDGTKARPYTEDDLPRPINAYGRSKLAGDRAIEHCGGHALILRTSWIYAGRGHNFLRTILGLSRVRDQLQIVDDQIGAPTWARDIADATASIVRRAWRERETGNFSSGIFNLTAAGEASWFGFAQTILEQAALSEDAQRNKTRIIPISSFERPLPAARPKNSRLAGNRVRARFRIEMPEWRRALALCLRDKRLSQ